MRRARSSRRAILTFVCTGLIVLGTAGSAQAAFDDPLFVFTPSPPSGPSPAGYLNGPCGVGVDATGDFYIADHYHRAIDRFRPDHKVPPFDEPPEFIDQPLLGAGSSGNHQGPLDDPCALAIDSTGTIYANNFHRNVVRFPAPSSLVSAAVIDSDTPTGVAIDPVTARVYVDARTHVAVYDSTGAPVEDGGTPLRIGLGTLQDGHGIAVSGHPATAGRIYVPDAATDTVLVYDPVASSTTPVQTIAGPPGGFRSLRDSAAAIDDASGRLYVLDSGGPRFAESPLATVYVFSAAGVFQGRLKHDAIDAAPSGLAVDNSGGAGGEGEGEQGRVYVTSGNSERATVYAYSPGAATTAAAPPLPSPGLAFQGQLVSAVPIGGETPAEPSTDITCEGDSCQILPAAPTDPTLTTTLQGLGNPRVRYVNADRRCRPYLRAAARMRSAAGRLRRRAEELAPGRARRLLARAERLTERSRLAERTAERCKRRAGTVDGASASALSGRPTSRRPDPAAPAPGSAGGTAVPSDGATTAAFLPGSAGFAASAHADGGGPATRAGTHPYDLTFDVGLDQGTGPGELRELRIDMPPGLLANVAAVPLCSSGAFNNPRSSPFPPSRSGENCPDRTQLGTLELQTGIGGGQARRFGLFNLVPTNGTAARVGAYPFGAPGDPAVGEPLVFDTEISLDSGGAYAQRLLASEVPQDLELHRLQITLWGTPWHAVHNGERGDCLNGAEPAFPWAKCSVGSIQNNTPLAYLTMPTECRPTLDFIAQARTWQNSSPASASAVNRDPGGNPVQISGCESLAFEPNPVALLSSTKASSASGFAFRLTNDVDRGLLDPHFAILSHARRAEVELPEGVTLNAALSAGLAVCSPEGYAAETVASSFGEGCPTESRIGDFRFRTPLYQGFLEGSVFLAAPDDNATKTPGAENPFDSLLSVYLVAKSTQRGFMVKLAGKIAPDPASGRLTATFEGLPQFPYTDLEVSFATGQRAPLLTPDRCGDATTRTAMTPWSGGSSVTTPTPSEIKTGADGGACPDPNAPAPPFSPAVLAGGVNANVGSYTPYYVHISRADTEQQLTSYSLTLPKGITGKLAGIPFCPEAAIAAARANGGLAEARDPSCPAASRIGATLTGYAVGAALTYAPGQIYLAGPYRGRPLSLVTVNSATVGSFDLGTIVIRSAFSIDPRTAQLQIDSSVSDPIPHIIDGFPLNLREVRIHIDRRDFTRNPTGCEASELSSTMTGAGRRLGDPSDDSTTTARSHFQLLNCLELGFNPELNLALRGGVRRGAYPELRTVLRARRGDASLRRIAVSMPHSLFLANEHIRGICTRPAFEAESCPPGSAYGNAALFTPLFDAPLRGPVFLRSSSRGGVPDLVASLRSGEIRIILEGRIGPSKDGGIRAFFDEIPDAPIDRFVLRLDGGRRGLLVNSVNVCAQPPTATVKALGHNNRGVVYSTTLKGQCKKKKKGKKRRRGGRR